MGSGLTRLPTGPIAAVSGACQDRDTARIAVVEEERDLNGPRARQLRRDGHEVEQAHDGTAGLAASRQFVEAMGGGIAVTREPGEGATSKIRLPHDLGSDGAATDGRGTDARSPAGPIQPAAGSGSR